MITTKLTSRGGVTIPKEIREHLGPKPGDRVVFVLKDGEASMRPAKPTLHVMRGSVEPRHEPEDFGAVRSKVRKEFDRRRAGRLEEGSRDG